MQSRKTGLLLVFEGIDGAGKSTLARLLYDYFVSRGQAAFLTREPGGSVVGKELRAMVQHQVVPLDPKTEFLLFAADRAQHIAGIIKPRLAQGEVVISDRMADSSCAYQGYGRGVDISLIKMVNTWVMDTVAVDLTIFVRVSLETARKRIGERAVRSTFEEQEHFLERVADGFEQLYQERTDVLFVDGNQPLEQVAQELITKVDAWLQTKK